MMNEYMAMLADDLIYTLKKHGWSQVALSRALNVDTSTINNVIKGRTTSRRIASFIAKQINKRIEEIWSTSYQSQRPINIHARRINDEPIA